MPIDKEQPAADLPAIEVHDLRFGYGTETTLSIEAFSLERGQTCAVIGPSGSGKTTFVHLLAGLLTAESGLIKVLGQDLANLSETERDRFRGRHVGFVFQRFHLMPALTVRENLKMAQRLSRSGLPESHIDEMLSRLGLNAYRERRPGALSHGQAQRVAIARALVHKPALVIADEPTSALDDGHASEALSLLTDIARDSRAALLVVTHDHRVRGRLARDFSLGGTP